VHLQCDLVPLVLSFADKVVVNELISLRDFRDGPIPSPLQVIRNSGHLQFRSSFTNLVASGGEGCSEGFELLVDFLNHLESPKYVDFDPFLAQKAKHQNDMLNVLLVISGPEGGR